MTHQSDDEYLFKELFKEQPTPYLIPNRPPDPTPRLFHVPLMLLVDLVREIEKNKEIEIFF